jgi:predicted NAD/FAD-binding protein
MTADPSRRSVAVVGAGVAGLTAAYLLRRRYRVTLYECEPRLGGHAHTHTVADEQGGAQYVDTGFIVHNDRTYPLLTRLFRELGIETRATEMSMSISSPLHGLEYAGGRGASGVFAQPRRLVDPDFLRLLAQVRRFQIRARRYLAAAPESDLTTLAEFLVGEGFSDRFRDLYAVPLVSCVWSTGSATALDYPARYLFTFLDHHGMLDVRSSPTWRTVVGGSRSYVDAIGARLDDVRLAEPVTRLERHEDGVEVTCRSGRRTAHDAVVVAVHADQALGLLADPTVAEKEVLSAFRYSRNETVLHTDERLLPRAPRARASWNFVTARPGENRPPMVTYWMNRLQGLGGTTQYLVTLNGRERIADRSVIAVMDYQHPVYDPGAVAAQTRLTTLSSGTTVYAGAYHGWGFHEDGCRSGVEAARRLGVRW